MLVMRRFKQTLGTASTVAQLLGLSLAILLLTPAGRNGIAKFGFLNVLLGAAVVFLVVGLGIVILVCKSRQRTGSLAGGTADAPSRVNSGHGAGER